MYILTLSFRCFISDKSPQMNEFLSHIKSSTEMSAMFESIQKDAQASISDSMVMDTSWWLRDDNKSSANCITQL